MAHHFLDPIFQGWKLFYLLMIYMLEINNVRYNFLTNIPNLDSKKRSCGFPPAHHSLVSILNFQCVQRLENVVDTLEIWNWCFKQFYLRPLVFWGVNIGDFAEPLIFNNFQRSSFEETKNGVVFGPLGFVGSQILEISLHSSMFKWTSIAVHYKFFWQIQRSIRWGSFICTVVINQLNS